MAGCNPPAGRDPASSPGVMREAMLAASDAMATHPAVFALLSPDIPPDDQETAAP